MRLLWSSLLLCATTAQGADIAISALPAASSLNAADVVPIVQTGTTKKASFTVQKSYWDTFYQSLDGDLTALSALTGTHTIYYRSAASTWTPVVIGNGLNFTGATLAVNTPTPTPTATPTATATSTPTPTPTPTPYNAFGTVAVSGQSDVVADSPSDTMNLAAGTNIAITTNAGTDTVTIATTGGGGDVSSDTATSVDAEIALFKSTTGKLIKRATGSGLVTATSGVYGTVTAPSGTVVGTSDTQTLTNKRITPRVTSISSSATPTINTDNCDAVTITALATAITSMTTNLSGTPNNFDKLIIRFKDDGTARGITWGASFASSQATLPTTTVISKVLTVGLIWDSVQSKWICLATDQAP